MNFNLQAQVIFEDNVPAVRLSAHSALLFLN